MDFSQDIITALASSAAPAVILGILLLWIMPKNSERHNQTVLRIIEANRLERKEDHEQLSNQMADNTKATRQLARAVLISQFMSLGKSEAEAEREAVRIIANGNT